MNIQCIINGQQIALKGSKTGDYLFGYNADEDLVTIKAQGEYLQIEVMTKKVLTNSRKPKGGTEHGGYGEHTDSERG